MSDINMNPSQPLPNDRRSAQDIRQDIDAEKEYISETVDRLGAKLNEKMDWRSYVGEYPVLMMGAAAGVGFVLSGAIARSDSPSEQFADNLRNQAAIRQSRQSALKLALLQLITKAVTEWIKSSVHGQPADRSAIRRGETNVETRPYYHS